ncbi:MAG: MBOAT family protein [Ferruginibacter sp.]|nr:MBOAT family protein [Ferruginibacter sp.]
MLFNSIEFIIFFPAVTLLYFLIPHKFRWLHLLLASCIFYAAFIPSYLLILFFLIIIDYSAGLLIERRANKRTWLIISIIANISLLGMFKYYNFFISNLNQLTGTDFILLKWILPIGLSFHTFQSLAYTIEVYHGRQKAISHAGYYALYVMFYPQLVAGPIERPQHLLPQLFTAQRFSSQKLYEGLRLMGWGFFKKLVIADRIGQFADAVFNNPTHAGTSSIWLAVFFFSIQIYADFSGYSDIAIGAARCMGINLSLNFNRPYQSNNIRQFWKRWHISLSSWFRDYVYIPLGGNRRGPARRKIYLMLTFLLSALWHGAGWTFLVWGFLHGIFTLVYDWFKKCFASFQIPNFFAWLITGTCVGFAWIFFRAASIKNAVLMILQSVDVQHFSFGNLLALPGHGIQFGNFTLALSFCMIGYMFLVERYSEPKLLDLNSRIIKDGCIFVSSILLILFFGVFQKSSFIYFQF